MYEEDAMLTWVGCVGWLLVVLSPFSKFFKQEGDLSQRIEFATRRGSQQEGCKASHNK